MLVRTTLLSPAWTDPTDILVSAHICHAVVNYDAIVFFYVGLVISPIVLNQDIPHIFAMTLFEEFIYWTDWETKSINRAHKTLGTNKTVLISTLHRPMDVHIYHPSRQPEGENI